MSNRLFQSVIRQMKDSIDRTIGVVDENGTVIACSELGKIGEVLDLGGNSDAGQQRNSHDHSQQETHNTLFQSCPLLTLRFVSRVDGKPRAFGFPTPVGLQSDSFG